MTSSVGVAVPGDTDLEGAVELRLGCGALSSSSEEITCTTRVRALGLAGYRLRRGDELTSIEPAPERVRHGEQRQVENLTAPG